MDINGLIMHHFFQITRIISRSLNNHFSPYNLHVSEWGIILTLMEKGMMTQRDLAKYLNIEPSAVSRSLVGLQKKGYIMRKVGVDRRERNIFLTELAIKQYRVWDSIACQYRQDILADLSEEKKQELYMLLEAVFQTAHYKADDKI